MSLAIENDLVLIATGLTPGDSVQASFEYQATDGSGGWNEGTGRVKVNTAGVARVVADRAEIVGTNAEGKPNHRPGKCRAWFHAPGPFDSPPIVTSEGEQVLEFEIA